MFNKNKNKKEINRRKIVWIRIFDNFLKFIRRYTVIQFVVSAVIITAAVIGTFEAL